MKRKPVPNLREAIENASDLEELKKLVANMTLSERVMSDDGTIRGLVYCAPSGKRGAVLQVSVRRGKPEGFSTSMIVDGRDFRSVYREIVTTIIGFYGFEQNSELAQRMLQSADAFLKRYGLQLTEIRYEQVSKISKPE